MDARLLVRSKFMVSHEFGTADIPREPLVTIADVKKPDEQEEMTKDWWLVHFAEPWAKPLKINRTHQQALILMFGADTEGWKGKRIGLHAIAGTFFGKRSTAVRIKGSPDIAAPQSFTVRKFGGGKDVYNLIVMPAPNGKPVTSSAPAPFVPDGKIRIGPKKGTEIIHLTYDELLAGIALGKDQIAKAKPGAAWVPNAQAHVDELLSDQARRDDIEKRIASGQPPAGKPTTDEDAPF